MKELVEKLQKVAGKLSVLVVEDEEIIRTQLAHYLERFFQRVVSASDGVAGLARLREEGPFDIIISDIRMPKMDGIEMMRIITEVYPDQKFIIASAHSDSSYFLDLISMGVFPYIIKPINYTQLIGVLLKLCAQLRTEEELAEYKFHLEELVTEQTKELREHYWTDPLTKLPNRIKLQEDLKEKRLQSIAVFNVDNFSKYNTAFGARFGDKVLKKVAELLSRALAEKMVLYRYASDEFFVRAEGFSQEALLEWVRATVDAIDAMSLKLMQVHLRITFTVGIAPCEEQLCIEHARTAVEAVREVGKGRIVLYRDVAEFVAHKATLLRRIDDVAAALKEERFIPYFQPIVENASRRIVKYECLARLQLEEGKVVLPGEFLPALEEAGFLPEMSRQIVMKSCAHMAVSDAAFSINITVHELRENGFVDFLASTLQRYGIEPRRLTVEILEGISLQEEELLIERLKAIKALGCRLSIDDFGTEGSNFSRMMALDVDYIKIDGSFIKNLDRDERSRKISRSIVAFAQSIGCQTIAEYVHSEAVWEEVCRLGIDFSQGYYFGAPEVECVR